MRVGLWIWCILYIYYYILLNIYYDIWFLNLWRCCIGECSWTGNFYFNFIRKTLPLGTALWFKADILFCSILYQLKLWFPFYFQLIWSFCFLADRLTCLLRNLYAGQEAAVRTGRGTTDWFQIRKGVHQGCILSPCLFNLHAEYTMRDPGLEEAQTGIKIAGRNINNFRCDV